MWTHNDDTIISGQDRITVSNPPLSAPAPVMSTLMRSSVIPLDAGNYTITATNPAGSNMYTFRVAVTGKFYTYLLKRFCLRKFCIKIIEV